MHEFASMSSITINDECFAGHRDEKYRTRNLWIKLI